jgi:outer membrane murein-binding lipoprotein Lpp
MAISFLEFCFFVLVFYVITQLFLPWLIPSVLETNWFFKLFRAKKNQTTTEKVNTLVNQKELLKKEASEIIDQTKTQVDAAKETHEQAKKLVK